MATLLEQWRSVAYSVNNDQKSYQAFWENYFDKETAFYESLLAAKKTVKGNVKTLAKKYDVDITTMTGILDGINDSLVTPNPLDTMDEETELSLEYDKEALYKNMVIAKADWLYGLPAWDTMLTEERRAELYKEAKKAGTIVKEKKIGRNDPCPCGSGKKYKYCCGRNK